MAPSRTIIMTEIVIKFRKMSIARILQPPIRWKSDESWWINKVKHQNVESTKPESVTSCAWSHRAIDSKDPASLTGSIWHVTRRWDFNRWSCRCDRGCVGTSGLAHVHVLQRWPPLLRSPYDDSSIQQQVGLAQWIALWDSGGQECLFVWTRILEEDVTKQKIAKKVCDNNLITE